jgi:hypothetical protein
MSDASRRVDNAAREARSNDDLVDDSMVWDDSDMLVPADEQTLDERASTQMGEMWESRRRGADE